MQFDTFAKAKELCVSTLFVNGLLDVFIIRRNIKEVRRANRRYVRIRRALGPHELTPRQGRTIARIVEKYIR